MLLFVCHANICRSAMAERIARLEFGALTATSAGTHARTGDRMHPGAAAILRELGADPDGFASQPVSEPLLARAGLVLTATREQRAFCVRLAPVVLRRAFTIRQFGRLVAALPGPDTAPWPGRDAAWPGRDGASAHPAPGDGPDLAALLARVAEVRGRLQPVEPAADDLADPVNGSIADIRACAEQIRLSLQPALSFIDAA